MKQFPRHFIAAHASIDIAHELLSPLEVKWGGGGGRIEEGTIVCFDNRVTSPGNKYTHQKQRSAAGARSSRHCLSSFILLILVLALRADLSK